MIGVFGGTFDPPHVGHLVLADEACGALSLSKVLWVVTGEPPHKPQQPITPVEHRIEMVARSIRDDSRFKLSRIEIDRPGPHFAAETLELLTANQPDETWAYVMGEDSLTDLPNWHRPARLLELCHSLAVLRRPLVESNLKQLERQVPGLAGKVHLLEVPLVDISARDIRRRVRDGLPFRYLVPTGVADYIREHQLYI